MAPDADRNGTQHPAFYVSAYVNSRCAHRACLRSLPHVGRDHCPGTGIHTINYPYRHWRMSLRQGLEQGSDWGISRNAHRCSLPNLDVDRGIYTHTNRGYYRWSGPSNNVLRNAGHYGYHCQGYRQGHHQHHCVFTHCVQCQAINISTCQSAHRSAPGGPPSAPSPDICCCHNTYVYAAHGLRQNLLHNCYHCSCRYTCRHGVRGRSHRMRLDADTDAASGCGQYPDTYRPRHHWQYLSDDAWIGCGRSRVTNRVRNGAHHP